MIQKISTGDFISLAKHCPVLDVRSPGEYSHAHIPGAHSLPLFTDEERKVVGTAYKQQSRQQAIKAGLDYFGPHMRKMVEATEKIIAHYPGKPDSVLVHCWRGGMRSAGVAWLLDLYGFRVYTLSGGYKAFRKWTLEQFAIQYPFQILGGYTGSGKTQILQQLSAAGNSVIDLEHIGNHKGSAFGALGEHPQPTQEMFENVLAITLSNVSDANTIWLEDESRRIGKLNIPNELWNNMRRAPVCFLDIPFEERLISITNVYGKYRKEDLVNGIIRIQKRLGTLNAKNAVNYLLENNYKESFRILLTYYDKYYSKDIRERAIPGSMLHTITCDTANPVINLKKLNDFKQLTNGTAGTGY